MKFWQFGNISGDIGRIFTAHAQTPVKIIIVTFHPFPQKPPLCGQICTKFGTGVWVADVITSDKFLAIG